MDAPAHPDPLVHVLAFCRRLRSHGLSITTSQIIAAVRTLERLDLTDGAEVKWGLRAVLASSPDERALFDRLFHRFWELDPAVGRVERPARSEPGATVELRQTGPSRPADLSVTSFSDEDAGGDGEPIETPGTSDRESLGTQDFSTFPDERLDDLLRIAMALARRLEAGMRRRWRRSGRSRLDLRRTIRANLARGEIIDLQHRRRRRRPLRLVAICDVSGSMSVYSRVLVLFVFALQRAFARVETFAF
jgi:uncharacterized protein with von Willebrand factor type A (vWA) domain